MSKILFLMALAPVVCFGQWNQLGNSVNGEAADDVCGWGVAISQDGNVFSVGSPSNDGLGSSAGHVRVFENINGVWTQIGDDLDGESSGDQTGQSSALSADGSVVAIGEPFNNDLGFVTGQVRVFEREGDSWIQLGNDFYGQTLQAAAGTSVDLSDDGSVVAIGAPNTTIGENSFAGNVRIFEYQNGSWIQKGNDIEGDGAVIKFGVDVSMSSNGNIIAIGQTGDPTDLDGAPGRVKVYEFINGEWMQLGNTIAGIQSSDEFGYSVSLSSDGLTLAVGAYAFNQVRVFTWDNGAWNQSGSTLSGENPNEAFGISVSLNATGTRLAVGARNNDSNGDNTGRAYVFEFTDANWVIVDNPVSGEAVGDQVGFSVGLSGDGNRIAVGAIHRDENGNNSGQVRVFENATSSVSETFQLDKGLSIYPIPASDILEVVSEAAISSLEIISQDGKTIKLQKIMPGNQFQIDISELSRGVYMLRAKSTNAMVHARFMKQ